MYGAGSQEVQTSPGDHPGSEPKKKEATSSSVRRPERDADDSSQFSAEV
jgi:hypothetical protein